MSKVVLNALMRMQPRPGFSADLMADPVTRARIVYQIENYPCVALPSAKDPAAISGMIYEGGGVAEVWMVAGINFEKCYRDIVRQHRNCINSMIEALGLHRVHMFVDPRVKGAARYARAVGFKFEAVLHGMSRDGHDLEIFYINKGR